MRLITLAALSAVSLVTFAAVQPAAAQRPAAPLSGRSQLSGQSTERITVIDENGRRTNRITVRPRSFLDPGTATRDAFQYHYADYAVPPN